MYLNSRHYRVSLAFIAGITAYFMIYWFTPWERVIDPTLGLLAFYPVLSILGIVIFRLGWNISPKRLDRRLLYPLSASILVSVSVVMVLKSFSIQVPMDDYAELGVLYVVAWAPVSEELFFRQFLFRWMEKSGVPGNWIISITSIAFGAAHLTGLLFDGPEYRTFYAIQTSYATLMGFAFGWSRLRSGSWMGPTFAHFLFNTVFIVSVLWLR